MRRDQDDPQDTDYTGYVFWLMKPNQPDQVSFEPQVNGNYINADGNGVSPRASYRKRLDVIRRSFDTAGLPARKDSASGFLLKMGKVTV